MPEIWFYFVSHAVIFPYFMQKYFLKVFQNPCVLSPLQPSVPRLPGLGLIRLEGSYQVAISVFSYLSKIVFCQEPRVILTAKVFFSIKSTNMEVFAYRALK